MSVVLLVVIMWFLTWDGMSMSVAALFSSMVVELVEENQTNHVDYEADDRYSNQPIVVDLDRRDNPLYTFAEDIVRNEDQENSVKKPTNCLHLAISISVFVISLRQLSDVRGNKSNEQSGAVEQHMECVRHQAKTVCPIPIEQLNEHESHVD